MARRPTARRAGLPANRYPTTNPMNRLLRFLTPAVLVAATAIAFAAESAPAKKAPPPPPLPGAGTGGRSVIAKPFDGRALGPALRLLRRPLRETSFHGMTIQAGADLRAFMSMTRSFYAFTHVTARILREPAPNIPLPTDGFEESTRTERFLGGDLESKRTAPR